MFNVGVGELLAIMLIGLIVLGPDKLPDAARKVGNVLGELRRMSSGFQAEMRSAVGDLAQPPPTAARDDGPAVPMDEPARREPAA
jgi:Tat protein translocase TatB subunit